MKLHVAYWWSSPPDSGFSTALVEVSSLFGGPITIEELNEIQKGLYESESKLRAGNDDDEDDDLRIVIISWQKVE